MKQSELLVCHKLVVHFSSVHLEMQSRLGAEESACDRAMAMPATMHPNQTSILGLSIALPWLIKDENS